MSRFRENTEDPYGFTILPNTAFSFVNKMHKTMSSREISSKSGQIFVETYALSGLVYAVVHHNFQLREIKTLPSKLYITFSFYTDGSSYKNSSKLKGL